MIDTLLNGVLLAERTVWMPESASTFSENVDWLFFLILWICVILFVLILTVMGIFVWRYRHREGYTPESSPAHSTALELTWTVLPSIVVLVSHLQQFALEQERRWELASQETQDGVNCNTGQGECKFGVKGGMTLVPVTQADKDLLQSWVPSLGASWAKACGADCVAEWNASMGKAIGLSLSTD